MELQLSKPFPIFCVYKLASLIIHLHCFQVSCARAQYDTKKCDTHVQTSFFRPQAKAVRELTQHVLETTSEVSEQDVGETTRRRNDGKPRGVARHFFLISPSR